MAGAQQRRDVARGDEQGAGQSGGDELRGREERDPARGEGDGDHDVVAASHLRTDLAAVDLRSVGADLGLGAGSGRRQAARRDPEPRQDVAEHDRDDEDDGTRRRHRHGGEPAGGAEHDHGRPDDRTGGEHEAVAADDGAASTPTTATAVPA